MTSLSRRNFLRNAGIGAAAVGLAACAKTTDTNGNTTYTVQTAKILSIVTSIESGLSQLATSATVVSVIGTANETKLTAALQKVAVVTGEVAATTAETVSVTVAKNWLNTLESAVSAGLVILNGFSPLLPATVNNVVAAVGALLPAIEAVIGAVSLRGTPSMSQAQAQAIIAQGL
ncbi:twin-arginine translocation signal domain-containing protein [Acetobacter musti]|uniref:Twin-arginine translocation signal domain-containing protein n=1 Tax=Acetobacter musti TaxID=864732 RepID=A0ABX0JKY2_9PROT|nr:twin-arginine translocation signal domain-containing protein [Acetobacter musti]NHN83685.1 twin-arginine translocation signal domain-containing protein [Acetobacter musti]